MEKLTKREIDKALARWNYKDVVDDGFPKWAPRMFRMTRDQMKLKKHFNLNDLRDIEYFAHYTQMGVLIVSFLGHELRRVHITLLFFLCVLRLGLSGHSRCAAIGNFQTIDAGENVKQ